MVDILVWGHLRVTWPSLAALARALISLTSTSQLHDSPEHVEARLLEASAYFQRTSQIIATSLAPTETNTRHGGEEEAAGEAARARVMSRTWMGRSSSVQTRSTKTNVHTIIEDSL